jgi:hypothetical protein
VLIGVDYSADQIKARACCLMPFSRMPLAADRAKGGQGPARNRLVHEQLQLYASLTLSAALLPAAIGGALDQFVQDLAGRDHASAPGPGVVSTVENHDCTIFSANVTTSINVDIKMVVGRARQARKLTMKGKENGSTKRADRSSRYTSLR